MCISCANSDDWIYTVNGCAEKQKPATISSEEKTETSSSSSGGGSGGGKDIEPTHSSSRTVTAVTSDEDEEEEEGTNVGMIVGIVVGCVAFVVIAAVAIYCFVTSGSKYGKIDPSIFEEDREFTSMAVL